MCIVRTKNYVCVCVRVRIYLDDIGKMLLLCCSTEYTRNYFRIL